MELKTLTEEGRLLLFVIIENNGNIDDLCDLGYEYVQITKFLKQEISDGNASYEEGKLRITEKGVSLKNELAKKLDIERIDKIVMPQLGKRKQKRISPYDIFIPSEDELTF